MFLTMILEGFIDALRRMPPHTLPLQRWIFLCEAFHTDTDTDTDIDVGVYWFTT